MLVLSCEADQGASGSPIFVIRDGVPRIVSVVTAMAEIRDRQVSLGTSLERPLEMLREMMDDAPADALVTRRATPTVRVFGTTRSGAKFVKPGE